MSFFVPIVVVLPDANYLPFTPNLVKHVVTTTNANDGP